MMGESQFYTPYEQDVPYGMSHNMPAQAPYGMSNTMPEPMGMMSSNVQGFPNYGSPYSNNYQNQTPSYKKGGHVSQGGLRNVLEALRKTGAGPDKILAHISPEEAEELAMTHGGDINPVSGLPQFGRWERFWERVFDSGNRAVERHGEGIARNVATILPSAVGGMFLGPLGSTLGGALGRGAFDAGNGNRGRAGRSLLEGGLTGAALGFLGPMAGRGMGLSPTGGPGTLLGMNPRFDMLSGAGLGNLFGGGGGSSGRASAFNSLQNLGKGAPQSEGFLGKAKGLLGGVFGGGGGGGSSEGGGLFGGGMLNNGLLGTAILGALKGKYETPNEKSSGEYMSEHGPRWRPEDMPREIKPYQRSLKYFNPETYSPGFVPEQMYFTGHGYDEPMRLAEGGHLFEGQGGGQDDNIYENLPEGGYVIDASTMSDLGDGNPDAGNKKLTQGLSMLAHKKHYKNGGVSRGTIKAKVSAKERFISPEEVTALGKGSNEKGASMLKNMVNNVRKQKRSNTKKLPPKAKSVQEYMRG